MPHKTFFLEPTGKVRASLTWRSDRWCPLLANLGNCYARVALGPLDEHPDLPPDDDWRSPASCECGYQFTSDDRRSVASSPIYSRVDTGQEMTLADAPIGALWDAHWFEGSAHHRPGPDGIHLVCRTPGGTWDIDGRAHNCTRPDDDTHRCWLRHARNLKLKQLP